MKIKKLKQNRPAGESAQWGGVRGGGKGGALWSTSCEIAGDRPPWHTAIGQSASIATIIDPQRGEERTGLGGDHNAGDVANHTSGNYTIWKVTTLQQNTNIIHFPTTC